MLAERLMITSGDLDRLVEGIEQSLRYPVRQSSGPGLR